MNTSGEQRGPSLYVAMLSAVAALGGLLFGYDTAVIAGAIGFLRSHFSLDAASTGWAASSALLGCLIGAGIAGLTADRLGRKKALLLAAVLYTVSGVWSAIPSTIAEFSCARILGGIGIGTASVVCPLYIAEIAPAGRRGRLVTFNQLAIVIGILVVYFVNYFIAGLGDAAWNERTGWRWMFGSAAAPAAVFFFLTLLIPESPRWLLQRGRREEAQRTLERVGGGPGAEGELRAISDALADEPVSSAGLLKGGLRKALVIAAGLAILQQVTGINVFMYYTPEIFKQLGSGTDTALLETISVGGMNLLFTLVALRVVDRFGRKPLMIIGASGMALAHAGLGLAAYNNLLGAWVLILVLGFIAFFAMSLGPVVWLIIAEVFPTRVRGRGMAIATLLLWGTNYIVSQTFPMLNEHPWLVATFRHAFPFMLYGSLCAFTVLFVSIVVPETRGKSLEEIEKLWKPEGSRA
ncbi:MAG TPA: sugar porter family MFS transporter [Bacteroidota bacterium]|nr:sugar porter family MFS transporter [Bacteroidota bacterium]